MNLPASVVWLRDRVASREAAEPPLSEPTDDGAEASIAPGAAARGGRGWAVTLVVALTVTLGALLVLMRHAGLEGLLRPQPAAIPEVAVERVVLAPGLVTVSVRNTGPEAVDVSQVTIDEAYRTFTVEPDGHLERLEAARLRIPYPWVAGEPLAIAIVDSTGTTHAHDVEAAAETPVVGGPTIAGYVVLGTYVGVIPVFLGMLFLPALARLGRRGLRFLLGVTAGLLVFLAVDALGEAFDLAGQVASVFHGSAVVFAGAAGTYAGLAYFARRRKHAGARDVAVSPLRLAYLVAIGIGLHNLGEGLAVGSAHARGDIALGTGLVVGFALHNITEGIGIASPTMPRLPRWPQLAALGAVAGLPTIAGTLLGGFAYSAVLGALFLAVGVGAIAEVVDELARYARPRSGVLLAGAAAGFALMYATALMIGA